MPLTVPDGNEVQTFPQQIRRKSISNQLRGLLEVEPLHFTCCAASDATRVEKMDSVASSPTNSSIIEEIMMPLSQSMSGSVDPGGPDEMVPVSKSDFDNKWAKVRFIWVIHLLRLVSLMCIAVLRAAAV